jgi:hypothetical protein
MTAIVIQFPQQTKSSSPRRESSASAVTPPRVVGVCRHCFARRDVADFSCFRLGKWCDGCLPVLEGMLLKAEARAEARRP